MLNAQLKTGKINGRRDWYMNSDIRIVTIRINQNILIIIHTFTKFLLNPEFAFA